MKTDQEEQIMKDYAPERLASQPIGYWSGEAYRSVVGRIRAELAVEGLTQPHWWTLNHVAGAPSTWNRVMLAEKLKRFDDLGIDFDDVFDDLVSRGWMKEEAGALTLTEEGEAGRLRARDRNARVHQQMHEGIPTADYVTTLN